MLQLFLCRISLSSIYLTSIDLNVYHLLKKSKLKKKITLTVFRIRFRTVIQLIHFGNESLN